MVYYDWGGRKQRPSRSAVAVCGVIVVCAAIYALSVWVGQVVWDMSHKGEAGGGGGGEGGGGTPSEGYGMMNWLDFLYFLSYVKASFAPKSLVHGCIAIASAPRRGEGGRGGVGEE